LSKPQVSVLVPAFNDAAYLGQTLASLAKQTFTDFEVLIQDDCSHDVTRRVADQWAADDARFKVETNSRNLGMTPNWNAALGRATGKYVIKLDGDDAMQNGCIEALVSEMEQAERPYAAYCRTISCDADLNPSASYRGDRAFLFARLDPLSRHVLNGHDLYRISFQDFQIWHSNAAIYRRDDLVNMGGWDTTWGCAADTDLILRVLERGEPICHNPYPGILYRQRTNSVSSRFREKGWMQWEGLLVHLMSLSRHAGAGYRLSTPLRKAWWRFWQNWISLSTSNPDELKNFPEPVRSNLMKAASQVTPPPRRVLFEGWTRQKLWSAKKSVAGWLSSAAEPV
jgi:glycosyltransferase involved in cell wall biosynthesis